MNELETIQFLQEEIENQKDIIKMLNDGLDRVEDQLFNGDPIGCHVEGKQVIGDKRPLAFEITCESETIARICAEILNDGFLSVKQAEKYFSII